MKKMKKSSLSRLLGWIWLIVSIIWLIFEANYFLAGVFFLMAIAWFLSAGELARREKKEEEDREKGWW